MAANTSPIFSRLGSVSWAAGVTAANTAKDGTGTVNLVFEADATNGSFLRSIKCKPLGTNVASLARFFVNNGSTNTTAANNAFFQDITLPAITNSETAAQIDIEIPCFVALDPGYRVYVVLATAVSAGWTFTAFGGKY